MSSGPFDHAARLRRFARALEADPVAADALVLAVLQEAPRRAGLDRLFADVLRRQRATRSAGAKPLRITPIREVQRALHAMESDHIEILALVVVESLPHDVAARVLNLTHESFLSRLTDARRAFSRVMEQDRPVLLRLVK